jgi:hypothetical protein
MMSEEQEPEEPRLSGRALLIIFIVTSAVILLLFALGAQTGPECWEKGLKMC